MSVWLISKNTAMVIVSQCRVKAIFLILAVDLDYMSIFLALKVLYEMIISIIQLAMFELTLK